MATAAETAESSQHEMDRKLLSRFLSKDEPLIWNSRPQLSRLFLRAIVVTLFITAISLAGIYLMLGGTSLSGFCAEETVSWCSKATTRILLASTVVGAFLLFLWASFLLHLSGVLPEIYGLTDRQAPKLKANPFDRIQSTRLPESVNPHTVLRSAFGSVSFGPAEFRYLGDADAKALFALSKLSWNRDSEHRVSNHFGPIP